MKNRSHSVVRTEAGWELVWGCMRNQKSVSTLEWLREVSWLHGGLYRLAETMVKKSCYCIKVYSGKIQLLRGWWFHLRTELKWSLSEHNWSGVVFFSNHNSLIHNFELKRMIFVSFYSAIFIFPSAPIYLFISLSNVISRKLQYPSSIQADNMTMRERAL